MRFRKKTFRRLGILLLTLALLAGVGAFVLHKKAGLREARLREDRIQGLLAFNSGDFSKSIERLEPYVAGHRDDIDAVLTYARAQSRIEPGTGPHLVVARERLEELLKRSPNHTDASHELIAVYARLGDVNSLNDLTARLLSQNPNDELAVRSRRDVFMETNRLAEALPLAERYAQVNPLDLDAHVRLLNIMYRLQKPQRDMLAYGQNLLSQHPDDARFKLLNAVALQQAGQSEQANQYLADAIAHPLPDSSFIKQLTTLLDRMRRFDDSQRVLESTAERTGDPELRRLLITRLWQDGRDQEVLKRLASLDAASPKSDVDLVALQTMALFQTGATENAKTQLQQLAERKDRVGPAWADAIRVRFLSDHQSPQQDIATLRRCVESVPSNGIFCQWIADSYWKLGETNLAASYWQRAAMLMPTWSTPLANLSAAQLELGAATDAFASAQSAFQRARCTQSQMNLAIVRYMQIERTGDENAARDLLNVVQQMQEQMPGEPNTLPIYISLLARSNRHEEARSIANTALNHLGEYSAETLLRLASVSHAFNLGLEEQFLSPPKEEQYTPRLTLALASHLNQTGKPDGAKKLLKLKLDTAPANQKLPWLLVMAQFLESTSDPTAAPLWKSLGDQNESDLDVQRTVLESAKSVRGDRPFIDRTISRLKVITGDDGQQWKIERARFLIESPSVDDAGQAAILLTDIVRASPRQLEPRIQLAKALARTGNAAAAVEHLQQAQAIDPRNATVTLELIDLLQSQGRANDVREALKRLASNAMMNVHQRVLLASMFADNGDINRATAMLDAIGPSNRLPPAGQALLGRLYVLHGKHDAARDVFKSLIDSGKASPDVYLEFARLTARQNDPTGARVILAKLTGPQTESILATFEEEYGQPASALSHYQKAAEAGSEPTLCALIDYQLRTRDFAGAAASAHKGLASLPASVALQNRTRLADAMVRHAADPNDLSPLIEALASDPARQADTEVLKALRDSRQPGSAGAIERLRSVADRFPQHLGVQRAVVTGYLGNHKIDDAIAVARRAVDALPSDPQAAKLLVGVLRVAERWPEMRAAAERWKALAPEDPIGPTTAMAQALLHQDQIEPAAKTIAPIESTLVSDKDHHIDALLVLAEIKAAQNHADEARALLAPLMNGPQVQAEVLDMAMHRTATFEQSRAWIAAVESAERTPGGQLALASAMQEVGKKFDRPEMVEQSLAIVSGVIKTSPSDLPANQLLAGGEILLGHFDKAEAVFRELSKDAKIAPMLQNDLAYVLIRQNKNLDEADQLIRSALSANPKSASILETQGRLQLAQHKLEDARKSFEAALAIDPALVDAATALAVTLRDMGDLPAARTQFERAESQAKARPEKSWHLRQELQSVRESLSRTE